MKHQQSETGDFHTEERTEVLQQGRDRTDSKQFDGTPSAVRSALLELRTNAVRPSCSPKGATGAPLEFGTGDLVEWWYGQAVADAKRASEALRRPIEPLLATTSPCESKIEPGASSTCEASARWQAASMGRKLMLQPCERLLLGYEIVNSRRRRAYME
jgi:hypothetical protein